MKAPKMIGRRLSNARLIREFDTRSDATSNVARSGLARGYAKLRIDDVLGAPGLTARMVASELRTRPDASRRIHLDWNLPAFLWEALLTSTRLQGLVTDYLGPQVRLDDFYVKSVMDGLSSVSEGWHDDNVGYRLKVFMVFDVEGKASGTIVVPTDRPNLYRIRVSDEMGRFFFTKKTDVREGALRVDYEAGDCLVFDTNIPHRGDYANGDGIRFCVIAEFIDRDKADRLRGRAPCGPGQSRLRIRIPALQGVDVQAHPLIDPRLLDRDGDGWVYGYRQTAG
jgi:hypothetical protein